MINELKELLAVIGTVPDMALNAFIMFGIYKLFVYAGTTAGIYGVIRLGINKYHDIKVKEIEKPKVEMLDIGGLFVSPDAKIQFINTVALLKSDKLNYIHSSDVTALYNAINKMKSNELAKQSIMHPMWVL